MRIGRLGLALVLALGAYGCDDGASDDADSGADMGDVGTVDMAMPDAVVPDAAPVCDCGDTNQTCEEGVCVENPDGCEADPDCLGDRICEEGACVEGQCAGDADCGEMAPALTCSEGRCIECADDDACFMSRTCNAEGRCIDPETCIDSRECDGVCVAGDNACEPAFDCNQAGCAENYICLPGGECAPSNPTGSSCQAGTCALGDTCVLSGRPAYCGACVEDDDCVGGQVCTQTPDGNVCSEPAVCGDDEDCLLGRTCEGGACEAPACDDDAFEGNIDFDSAAPVEGGRVIRGLVSCAPDVFTLNMAAGAVAVITVRQRDTNANLELAVFNRDQREIGRSATSGLTESVVVGPFASERPVTIWVGQTGPWSVGAYDLEIEIITDDQACVDDGAEQGTGDDSVQTARIARQPGQVGFQTMGGKLCPGDADYICFRLNSRERFSAHIEATTGDPNIVGEVFRADDEASPLGSGSWTRAGGEDIEDVRAANGIYCIRLTTTMGAGAYVATFNSVPQEVVALCDDAEVVSLDDGFAQESGRIDDDTSDSVLAPSCAPAADGVELAYTVPVGEPSLLIARVRGANSGTLGGPVVSVRGTCTDSNTELGCASGSRDPDNPLVPRANPAEVRVPVTEPGNYTVFVDGVDVGNAADFDLEVEVRALESAPRADRCESARPVPFSGDVADFTVNLENASDDLEGCLGHGGPDAVYELEVETPTWVTVQVTGQPNDFAVGAYLQAECGDGRALACGFGFDQLLEPGTYYVVIDGADANSRGRARVQVSRETFGDAPANETCADAMVLDAAGGELTADTRGAADDTQEGCDEFNGEGGDVMYRIPAAGGQDYFVVAVPEGGWDLSLAARVGDCDGRRSCSDGALTETLTFVADEDRLIFVDGSNGEAGRFTLRWGVAECTDDRDCDGGRVCTEFRCR